jgi:hypothetical protein
MCSVVSSGTLFSFNAIKIKVGDKDYEIPSGSTDGRSWHRDGVGYLTYFDPKGKAMAFQEQDPNKRTDTLSFGKALVHPSLHPTQEKMPSPRSKPPVKSALSSAGSEKGVKIFKVGALECKVPSGSTNIRSWREDGVCHLTYIDPEGKSMAFQAPEPKKPIRRSPRTRQEQQIDLGVLRSSDPKKPVRRSPRNQATTLVMSKEQQIDMAGKILDALTKGFLSSGFIEHKL